MQAIKKNNLARQNLVPEGHDLLGHCGTEWSQRKGESAVEGLVIFYHYGLATLLCKYFSANGRAKNFQSKASCNKGSLRRHSLAPHPSAPNIYRPGVGKMVKRAPGIVMGKFGARNLCIRGVWAAVYSGALRDGLHDLPMGGELLSLHNRTASSINICSDLGAQP